MSDHIITTLALSGFSLLSWGVNSLSSETGFSIDHPEPPGCPPMMSPASLVMSFTPSLGCLAEPTELGHTGQEVRVPNSGTGCLHPVGVRVCLQE